MTGRAGRVTSAAAVTLTVFALGACGSGDGADGDRPTLTLYNAQHEDLVSAMVDAFTAETGIDVEIRSGADFELANQLAQEGEASPADVFVTENSPAMSLVDGAGLFAPVDADTLAQVPDEYEAADGRWLGFAARATTLVYNPAVVEEADLPTSIMDLADPQWEGRIGIAAAGADFQAIVSAVLELEGEQATADWLAALKQNALIYPSNIAVMAAANVGQIQAGIMYHYYWYQDQAEAGEQSANTELKFFGNQDPGAFVSVSGAGVLASSEHPEEAQQLVAFLTGDAGQQVLADSTALEYTLNPDVAANSALPPLDSLEPPVVDPNSLNGPEVVALMQQAGLL